jgi:hypothetical protein
MAARIQRKRASKHLLVAAMGVATVSYVSTQSGCAPDTDVADEDPSNGAPYDDEAPVIDSAEQALSVSASAASATNIQVLTAPKIVLPPVGNLMAPPVGNLMAPPVVKPPIVVVPVLPPVGNLMAPPPVLEIE